MLPPSVWTEYVPCVLRSAFSSAVSCGLIGPVWPLKPAWPLLISTVTRCEAPVWLVTIRVIGPAPKRLGETGTAVLLIDAVMTIGLGGRFWLRWLLLAPQPPTTTAA